MSHSVQELPQDPLLTRFFLSPEEKASKEKGKAIIKAFYTTQTNANSSLNSFVRRNARWMQLLLWADGEQDMQQFLGFMNVSDANKAFTNMDMTQVRIAVQFLNTLVESMAKNKMYPCVNAIDDGSMNEKEDRLFDSLYRMKDIDTINTAQDAAGIQLEPAGAFVPDDEMAAKVYFELQDRLPKESSFEEMLNCVLDGIRFEKSLNRKTLFDVIVVNAIFGKIERVGPKKYTVRKCIPSNMVYNFFPDDTGELAITQIGEFYNLKVKDYRRKFGKSAERPDGLTEEEIFNLAKLSTQKNLGTFNFNWNPGWGMSTWSSNWPYDDYSILVLDCEINCGEDAYYVSKKDAYGKEDIQAKRNIPYQQTKKDGSKIEQPKPDDVEIIKRQKNTWMRGVYAPYGDKLLYWGPADLIIPQYTDVYNPLSTYTVVIPGNNGRYIPSLFERGMEILKEYQFTKLTRKKLIAGLRPSGVRIDVESARNIDLGNGDSIEWEEVLRIYNQTGNELWSSKGLDPLQREQPALGTTPQDQTIDKIIGLTQIMESQRMELREVWGVPPYRDGSDVGDRTSGVLQEQQNLSSYNVTDNTLNANNLFWEEVCYKLCLLHWNDIVKEEPESKDDMLNTRFKVSVKMKATEYEKQLLEADIQRYSQMPDAYGNPSLTAKDVLYLREIDNYKLAVMYLDSTIKENRRRAAEEAAAREQANAEVQAQAAQQKAEGDMALLQQKLETEKQLLQFKSTQDKELAALNGILTIAGKGLPVPPYMQAVIQQLIPNLVIPLSQENQQMVQAVQQQEMAQQEEAAIQEQEMQQAS